MSRAWMPLYVSDYLADTGHLTATEHGAYLLLIMHYWQNGSLPTDEVRLARIARLSTKEWRRSRESLNAFFDQTWKHKRIEDELARAAEISNKRKEAGVAGANSRYGKSHGKDVANASDLPKQTGRQSHRQSQSQSQSQSPEEDIENISSDFDRWYREYPRREGRGQALRAFKGALKKASVDTLIAGAKQAQARYANSDPKFIPMPATWLNGERWADQYVAPERVMTEAERVEANALRGLINWSPPQQ